VRSFLLVSVAVTLGVALTACSDKTTGQPQADSSTQSTTSGSGGPFSTESGIPNTTSSQPGASDSPVKDTKPCTLLSTDEATGLQAGAGTEQSVNNARACRYLNAQGFSLAVAIYDSLGLGDVTAQGEVKPISDVGKHKAVQWIGVLDTCVVSLEVTSTSRVDVQATSGKDQQKACGIALQAAKLVEPKLHA
jgi:hypothetical protein